MKRRIFVLLAAIVLLSNVCLADVTLQPLPGLSISTTYLVDFSDGINGVNPDYVASAGLQKNIFTRVDSASLVATYYSAAGTMLTSSTNTERITEGYYNNVPGFHAFKGLIMEEAKTNQCTYSQDFTNAAWVISNTTDIVVAANSVAGLDGTTTADTLTSAAANSTITQTYTAASALYTVSVFLKRKTGTGVVNISANGGTAWTACTLTTDWGRYYVSATTANPTLAIQIVTNADAVYAWGAQIEVDGMTSYMPSLTTAVGRSCDYCWTPWRGALETSNGYSVFIKAMPWWDGAVSTSNRTWWETGNPTGDADHRTVLQKSGANTRPYFYMDIAGGSSIQTITYSTTTAFISKNFLCTSVATGDPNKVVYVDGVLNISSNTDQTVPVWGPQFMIGCRFGKTNESFNGIVQKVWIGNGVATQTDATYLQKWM